MLLRSVIWFLAYVGWVEEIWISAYKASIPLYAWAVLLFILPFQIIERKIFYGYLALAKYTLTRTIRTVNPNTLRRISESALIGNISHSIRIQLIVFISDFTSSLSWLRVLETSQIKAIPSWENQIHLKNLSLSLEQWDLNIDGNK